MTSVLYRTPTIDDADVVHKIVQQTPELDNNSWYYYALMFHDFRETCIVAELNGTVVGFVTGYIKSADPKTLFLWQTATTLNHGVPNMGLSMLTKMISKLREEHSITYVEATVDPENRAINMQFRLLARALNSPSTQSILFSANELSGLEHDEQLIRIGPLA